MKVFILFSVIAAAIATRKCGENQHYDSCGTACPLTCDNYADPPKACILMCKPGCHCDEGFVKTTDGRCVKPEECPVRSEPFQKSCRPRPDTGRCRNYTYVWGYDSTKNICFQFLYGGCEGNGNRFDSYKECMDYCENCRENELFKLCISACPLTCDNYDNPPKSCALPCRNGCECNKGYVKTSDRRCVKPEECVKNEKVPDRPSRCYLPVKAGHCDFGRGFFVRYFFNNESGQCEAFVYQGCGGNDNNFGGIGECQNTCAAKAAPQAAPQACLEDKVVGPCRGAFPRFYFNKDTRKCESFIYGGCNGNSNNFNTQGECEAVCS